MKSHLSTYEEKKEKIIALTHLFFHKYYCEGDIKTFISYMDDDFSWFGTGEHEYAVGKETVADIFESFIGRVPQCDITDEDYHVLQATPEVFICTGRLLISTSPSPQTYLRVHQRVSIVFRWNDSEPRCCHIHISNPYTEMTEGDVGFPEKMSHESRKYFQEQIERQKQLLEEQHRLITQIYSEDLSTGLYNRNKFNQVCQELKQYTGRLGIAYFDLNGLKKTNDLFGHQAGDELIRRTADYLRQVFASKVYRIGGDEFIVIDCTSDSEHFYHEVSSVYTTMERNDISISYGISWRASGNIEEQIHEADQNMYRFKQQFYARKENNRRQNPR